MIVEASQLKDKNNVKVSENKSDESVIENRSQEKAKGKLNRFIVKYKENKEENGKEKIERLLEDDIKSIKRLKEKKNKKQSFDLIVTKNNMDHRTVLDKLKLKSGDADIQYIQLDYKISLDSNDTYYSQQWALGDEEVHSQEEYYVDADIVSAWESSLGSDTLVAVIDTGIDTGHEDLSKNIWINENEIPHNGMDDDGNGYVDDINGWNFSDDTNIVYAGDTVDESHGTHIAGIIAAEKDNGKGIAGTAPEAKIMTLKAFNNGVAYTSDIIEAIQYAEDMGAHIVNCSWGGFDENPALREAIEEKDMLFVCSAGNRGVNTEDFPLYPGAYESQNIISVGSINSHGELSVFSNYGKSLVDVAAPGEDIISTLPGNNYGELSGTSMAAAFVSGEAALVLSKYGNISTNDIRAKIMESSDKLISLNGKVYQGNSINCKNAVLGLMGDTQDAANEGGAGDQDVTQDNTPPEENSENVDNNNPTSEDGGSQNPDPGDTGGEAVPGNNSTDGSGTTDGEPKGDNGTPQGEKLLDLDEMFEDKAVGKILSKVKKYSRAKDGQKSVILDYFKTEENVLIECEKRGYSLIDSIFAASTVKDYGFSLDEIEKMLETYISIEEIYKQLSKLEIFKNEEQLSEDLVKEAKDLILDGYHLEKVKSAYNESKTLEKGITAIIHEKEKNPDLGTLSVPPELGEEPASYDAPFDYRRNSKEYIRAGDGSLTYEETDINLPGRNGLALDIITRYQMKDAGTFTYLDRMTIKRDGASPFGLGWDLGFSSLYKLDGSNFLRLATGETYELRYSLATGWTIEDYGLKDIKFENDDNSFNNGQENSKYVLIYKDGKKEYFGREGNLLGIVDRYGNTIKFEHRYWGHSLVIDKIIDTLGRSIDISYGHYVSSGIRKTVITAPDNSTVELILQEMPNEYTSGSSVDQYKLIKKIDQEGRETDFKYSVREGIYNDHTIVTIDTITYPTGGKSYYSYEKQRGRIGDNPSDYREYHRITSRYDDINGVRYNEETYSYIGDYTAYGVSGWENLKDYTYTTIITDSENTKREITFKKYNGNKPSGRKIKEEIKTSTATLLRQTNYGYDSNDLPIREEVIAYNHSAGTSMAKEIRRLYDSGNYGNMIEYTDELGNKTTYTYDSNFHQLESEERSINSGDYQKTFYHIDPSNGNVDKMIQHYLSMGALRFIETDYTYDSYGNVIREKTQMEDGTHITKNYEYNPQYQHGYLTRVYTEVEGYDLSSLTKTSETIEEKYDYTFNTGNKWIYINGNGKTTLYNYDKLGRIKEIHYLEINERKTIDYDDSQNIVTVTDEEGNQIKHSYDKLGRLFKKQEQKDGVWITTLQNGYNLLSQLAVTIDGEDNMTWYEYDDLGRNVQILHPDLKETFIVYDDVENSKIILNEEEDTQKYYYDKLGNLIKEEVKPDKAGPATYTTSYTYDYIGNMTGKIDANNHETKYEYDNMSRLISVTDPYGKMTKYEYSYLGDLKKITTGIPAAVGGYQLASNKSNSLSQSLLENMLTTQSTGITGQIFFYQVDINDYNNPNFGGLISQEQDIPLGEERSHTAPVIDTDTQGNEFEIESIRIYDVDEIFNTNPTPFKTHILTDEEKSSGSVSYTQRLTEEHSEVIVMFSYVKKDNAPSQGSVVTREYDELGRLIKETDPLNKDIYIDYDKVGNIIGKRDKKQQITTFVYDDRNRLLNQYAGTESISYTYDAAGKVRSMVDGTGITNYTYYENGKLKRQTGPDGKYIEYDYDRNGNRIQTLDYFGKVITYGYDNRNRLETVTVDGQTTTYSYYPDGARKNIIYPGGTKEEYLYDGINNLKTIANIDSSGATINEFHYTYDGVGNQLTKVDANGTTNYTYDKLNRLETISEPDGSQTIYTFDNNGNIATKDMVHPSNYSFTFKQGGVEKEMREIINHTITFDNDKSNKLTKVTEIVDNTGALSSPYVGSIAITVDLAYDDNGNLITTTKGGDADTEISSYKYNELNQMTDYTSKDSIITSYSYNGNGLRKTKTSSGTTTGFYYQGPNVINETENGILRARNIRGINIIAREDNGGIKAYYIYNGHGDVVNLVTDTGAILNTYDYDAYGKEKIAVEGTIKNPYRYAGEYYDEESKLYYLRARYYDPNIARFITEDSYKGDVTYPLSLNLYTYSWNNPIKYVDPSGHDPITIISIWIASVTASPDTQMDMQFISDNLARGDYLGAGLDALGMAIPGATGISKTADDIAKFAGKKLDDLGKGTKKLFDIDLQLFTKGTGKAANIGKFYKGAGTVVESSPVSKIKGIFTGNKNDPHHFVNRVIERGLKPDTIMDTFRNPKVILSQWKGQRFRYISDEACIVVNKEGEIITGWLKDEFGDVIKQILKEAN